jgi:hypothetical protein
LVEPSGALAEGALKGGLTKGDAAILRFLAAAEIIETDLWQQYNELAGIQDSEVPGGSGNAAYTEAVAVLDEDMDQYIHDNTDDEISHAAFINAYLKAHGAQTVNLNKFRNLPSSQATGAQRIGRLTNLMEPTVDTSFWTRYRSDSQNPDFGNHLPQAVSGLAAGRFPAIPRSDDESDLAELVAVTPVLGFISKLDLSAGAIRDLLADRNHGRGCRHEALIYSSDGRARSRDAGVHAAGSDPWRPVARRIERGGSDRS